MWQAVSWVFRAPPRPGERPGERWVCEPVLNQACDIIADELDWDSLDAGRLHWTTCRAVTLTGETVVVGVLSDLARLGDVLDDARQECKDAGISGNTPIWLYVPDELRTMTVPEHVELKPMAMDHEKAVRA